jgi:HK97 family phage portal protein
VSTPQHPRGRAPRLVGSWPRGRDIDTRPGVNGYTATDGRDMLFNSPDGWEVERPWLWWQGPAGGDGTGGPLGNPPRGATVPPFLPVAVTRCTSLIADTLAGLPWQVRRDATRERLETPDWISDPQALRVDQRIVAGPVPEWRHSAVEFWGKAIVSMLWAGEAMVYVPNRGTDGAPVPPLWLLNPADVGVADGRYVINPGDGYGQPDGYEFAPGELIVIRGLLRDGIRGVGVLQAHFLDLALAGAIRGFGLNMFRAGVPNGYLKVNAPQLTLDKAHELQANWMRAHGGVRKRIAVLNATTEFHPIAMDANAMQLAQMRDYSNLDIALMFGVPPYMVGIQGDRSTYANVESRLREFAEFTLLPWARRCESALDAEFPRGTSIKVNMDALVRADTLTRYQAHKIALDSGFLTVDEVRELEDRPPMPEEEPAAAPLVLVPASGAAAAARQAEEGNVP